MHLSQQVELGTRPQPLRRPSKKPEIVSVVALARMMTIKVSSRDGPLMKGAEMSDKGDYRRRTTAVDVALPHAVYTSGQMLEIHLKNCHFCHFGDLRRGLQAGMLRGNTLQHHEIGQDLCSAVPVKTECV